MEGEGRRLYARMVEVPLRGSDLGGGFEGQRSQTSADQELAVFPPFELQALRCREIYLCTRNQLDVGLTLQEPTRVQARRNLLESWRTSLNDKAAEPGLRVLVNVRSNWDVWLVRRWASLDVQG
jgi:hypothetical protein